MTPHTVIISVGSNIDPETNIARMIELLGQEVEITGLSPMVKTKPIGIVNQPEFTNGALKLKTILERQELKNLLRKIEDQLGRDRNLPKFGPRTIDLDIVVWNGEIIDQDYYTRNFLRTAVDALK
jgi:2-amino-4-hydroxy-6-hydroxymethyldihydropteridine diphosphokinase